MAEDMASLAAEVMDIGRTRLLLEVRFLDRALAALRPEPWAQPLTATDGQSLYYPPEGLARAFRRDAGVAVRAWLHPLLHCVFRHMFVGRAVDAALWDISCDMAAEGLIDDMGLPQLPAAPEARQALEALRKQCRPLTAEKLYRQLCAQRPTDAQLDAWRGLFAFDSHALWYGPEGIPRATAAEGPAGRPGEEDTPGQAEREPSSGSEGQQPGQAAPSRQEGDTEGPPQPGSDLTPGAPGEQAASAPDKPPEIPGTPAAPRQETARLWRAISAHMETALETFAKDRGARCGAFTQALRALNRDKCDYAAFLRRFAARCEVPRPSDEEFDYAYYTYGLRLYRDMPLIEPLEYREDRRIRDFVIAIDTSGSVQGETVQRFLQKTWSILRQRESYDQQVRLRLIQCDAAIREEAVITGDRELADYFARMRIKGLGGTDFRPVFRRVAELRRAGALPHLAGMLYFTDGLGVYPAQRPDWLTAFVFVEEDSAMAAPAPPWAIRVLLREADILEFGGNGR